MDTPDRFTYEHGFMTYADGLFIWRGTPDNRHLPKEAGFSWTSHRSGCWTTADPTIAWALDEYADAKAKRALRTHHPGYGGYGAFRKRQREKEGEHHPRIVRRAEEGKP